MIPAFTNDPLCSCWPFWVLELTPEASAADIEKAANEIMAKIKFKLDEALQFHSPKGSFERDEYIVREAKSLLQDPQKRLLAEYWYVEPDGLEQDKSVSIAEWQSELGVEL